MNYFSVSIYVPGPYSNCPGAEPEIDDFAWNGDKFVEFVLTSSGVEFLHEYSWPDGSCYKYVRSNLTSDELKKHLNFYFIPSKYEIMKVIQVAESTNPYKVNPNTYEKFSSIKEYFDFFQKIR